MAEVFVELKGCDAALQLNLIWYVLKNSLNFCENLQK